MSFHRESAKKYFLVDNPLRRGGGVRGCPLRIFFLFKFVVVLLITKSRVGGGYRPVKEELFFGFLDIFRFFQQQPSEIPGRMDTSEALVYIR